MYSQIYYYIKKKKEKDSCIRHWDEEKLLCFWVRWPTPMGPWHLEDAEWPPLPKTWGRRHLCWESDHYSTHYFIIIVYKIFYQYIIKYIFYFQLVKKFFLDTKQITSCWLLFNLYHIRIINIGLFYINRILNESFLQGNFCIRMLLSNSSISKPELM